MSQGGRTLSLARTSMLTASHSPSVPHLPARALFRSRAPASASVHVNDRTRTHTRIVLSAYFANSHLVASLLILHAICFFRIVQSSLQEKCSVVNTILQLTTFSFVECAVAGAGSWATACPLRAVRMTTRNITCCRKVCSRSLWRKRVRFVVLNFSHTNVLQ